mgnify:CR=1 FL=1
MNSDDTYSFYTSLWNAERCERLRLQSVHECRGHGLGATMAPATGLGSQDVSKHNERMPLNLQYTSPMCSWQPPCCLNRRGQLSVRRPASSRISNFIWLTMLFYTYFSMA